MAKIAFTKLGLKKQEAVVTVHYNNLAIEVKQYLPVNDKLALISRVVNNAQAGNNFINPVQVDIFTSLEIIYTYTNLSFTDKQKEDVTKLYDLLTDNNIFELIFDAIPEEELEFVIDGIWDTIDCIYDYNHSVLGLLENISNNYENLNLDVNTLVEKIRDPESLELLRGVLTKLG